MMCNATLFNNITRETLLCLMPQASNPKARINTTRPPATPPSSTVNRRSKNHGWQAPPCKIKLIVTDQIMAHAYCAVFKCPSSSRRHKEVKFHKFPRDPERRECWVEACRRPELKKKTVNQVCNMHVCGLHFEDYMYGKNQLKDTAIPTVNLPLASTHSVYTQTESYFVNTQVKEETDKVEGMKIKKEYEENGMEYCHHDRFYMEEPRPKIIKTEHILDTDVSENSLALVTLAQFQQGCELYLSPELCQYVKTQVRIPD